MNLRRDAARAPDAMQSVRVEFTDATPRPAATPAADPRGLGASELERRNAVFTTHLEQSYTFTASAVDRYKNGSGTVLTAAGALGVLYTGGLALVFGEGSAGLPARGLLTPLFLAGAVILSSWYLAFQEPRLADGHTFAVPEHLVGSAASAEEYLRRYRRRVVRLVTQRLWALQGSVLALTFAIVFTAAPFVGSNAEGVPVPEVQPTAVDESAADDGPLGTVDDGTLWPTPPASASAADLLLFEAQVAEAVALREAARAEAAPFFTARQDLPWLGAGAGALVLVFLPWMRSEAAPWVRRRSRDGQS